ALLLVPILLGASLALARSHERIARAGESRTGVVGVVQRFAAATAARLHALRRPARFVGGGAYTLAQEAVEGLAVWAAAAASGLPLPGWAIVASVTAVNLSTLAQVTPANVGAYEGSAFLVYRAVGLDRGTALALALVQHAVYLLPLTCTG